ncbi:MAG TPA: hypothetical protein VHC97_11800 [Thermoanaerobaculia bacterium]|jgi:CubicO group peptidase (beta-lactamase class C family)|nr:hypothetical protein [Thermoanaerobaculia bacterium]
MQHFQDLQGFLPRWGALARALFWLFAMAFVAAPAAWASGSPSALPSDADLARYADQLFSKAYAAGEPGAAVLVAKDGQALLRKGYGMASVELGVPMQPTWCSRSHRSPRNSRRRPSCCSRIAASCR